MSAAESVKVLPRGPVRNKAREALGGSMDQLAVANKDPNRFYAWPYRQGVGAHSMQAYAAMGYFPETYSANGVIAGPHWGNKQHFGQMIEVGEHVLMSCHIDDHADIQRTGEDGQGGHALIDQLFKQMSRRKDPWNQHRGVRPEGPTPDPNLFRFGDMTDQEMS